MQSWRLEGIINRWQKSSTVLQDRNTSVFEDRVSTETGSSGINTQTIKHQLQSNYCTMTSSSVACSSGDRCMSVTTEILRLLSIQEGDTMTTTTDKGMVVSCQERSDNNQWGILHLSGDTHTHTHDVQSNNRAFIFISGTVAVALSVLIGHMRIEPLINERGATMTCYVNGSTNTRAGFV